jgi:hypothetical protein
MRKEPELVFKVIFILLILYVVFGKNTTVNVTILCRPAAERLICI